MKLKYYLHRAISIPPHRLTLKVVDRTGRKIKLFLQRQNDIKSSTYTQSILSSSGELHRYLQALPINLLHSQVEKISVLSELFFAHQFNLLGSGWVQVKHGMSCRGLEGYRYEMGTAVQPDSEGLWLEGRINQPNLAESQRIWSLVDHDYIPIDWHLDFKSGYRWNEDTWYLDIPYGHEPGVDIKIPWELARMQHLPLLAWAYALAKHGQERYASASVYSREFRNQVLDFIATNPPRFGVNWRSTMDVAIRVANWLVIYDLFRAYGVNFDDSFRNAFFHSIYQHGDHIVNNLEWNETLRGNHYLSDIIGLLFVASYLPCAPETNSWLAFAIQELVNEVKYQFSSDGTNFEASTSYLRLSAEMVVYATALVVGFPGEKRVALEKYDHHLHKGPPRLRSAPLPLYSLPGRDQSTPFPPWYIEKLEKMADFIMHITKQDGHIPQIGDNDSGRFLKLQPLFHPMKAAEAKVRYGNLCTDTALRDPDWNEDHLDHRHLVAAINGLFERKDFAEFTGSGWVETGLIRHLAKDIGFSSYKCEEELTTAERVCISANQESQSFKLYVYPDFGLYIFRSINIYLAIRCGSIGQNGNGGHAHNDNLSFELNIKGKDFIVDGGSYLYTPFPEIRNMFRSTRAHSTLMLNGHEQNAWTDGLEGLFSMRNDAKARVLELSTGYLRGEHYGFGPRHYRQFELKDSSLSIEDSLESDIPNEINFNLAPDAEIILSRENGSEEYFLEMCNGDIHLRMFVKGFNGVEICDGFFSPGYGKRVKNSLVRCYRSKPRTRVEIDFELLKK